MSQQRGLTGKIINSLDEVYNYINTIIQGYVLKTGDIMTGTLLFSGTNGIVFQGSGAILRSGFGKLQFSTGSTTFVGIGPNHVLFPVQAPTASAPSYVEGGLYYDTTLHKLRVGGVSAWETVTSV